ncbi:hypothetical protein ACEQ8H_000179 [Pleosporales sp. CAS-2024a]
MTDIACICASAVIDKVSCCVNSSCSDADRAATTQLATQLCHLARVNINTMPLCPAAAGLPTTPSASSVLSSASLPTSFSSATSAGGPNGTASATTSPSTPSVPWESNSASANFLPAPARCGFGAAVAGLLALL